MTYSAQPTTTRGTTTTPPQETPTQSGTSPLAPIGSVEELTAHHAVPSLKQLCFATLDSAEPSFSMLEEAFYRGSDSIIALLKGKGVNIDTLQSDGHSLLHFACYHQKLKQIERLLRLGSDPNHFAESGETPLILAFSKPHANPAKTANIMRMLLRAGAKTEIRWDGQTPLLLACMLNNETAFSVLLEAKANRSATSRSGRTLVQLACDPAIDSSIFCTLLDFQPELRFAARNLLDDFEDEQSILKLQYLRPAKRKRAESTDETA